MMFDPWELASAVPERKYVEVESGYSIAIAFGRDGAMDEEWSSTQDFGVSGVFVGPGGAVAIAVQVLLSDETEIRTLVDWSNQT